MEKISCNVSNCSHNKENTCYANIINVGGKSAKKDCDTCCGSFLDSKNYGSLTSNVNQSGSNCTAINCNVGTCIYNSNNICTADSIQVSGEGVNIYTETRCSTFKSK
ncbi:DUF1540 domain-containing protein [Haloimpatiens sp. FM7330]|uniref:DUF1540 domain-containing protein n=1 Tax=Haloimpatiens sp. FM7330 TaxID=3298610 RepID=UPI00363793AA